jgi:hypothetical protein
MIAACGAPDTKRSPADSSYAAVQERGKAVMGVDQYTSQHVFEDLPDGGRIVLDRDAAADSEGIAQIRAHMREIATDFENGDFAKPFAVHAMAVPGTDIMSLKKTSIDYNAVDRPRGGEVRITSTDSSAVNAIHRFLAFQRSDHRASGTESMGSHTMSAGRK